MYRIIIIDVLYNVIVHQVGHLPRVVPRMHVQQNIRFFHQLRGQISILLLLLLLILLLLLLLLVVVVVVVVLEAVNITNRVV